MKRFVSTSFQLLEVFISSAIHMLYGFYIASTVVASDLVNGVYNFRKSKPEMEVKEAIDEDDKVGDMPPVVLVHGIFGFGKGKMGGLSYFAGAEKKDQRVLVPDLGSLTSIYDRARELFYYMKGGRVDYGEEHSEAAGHMRFGREYHKGNYPKWDGDHPVHFVCHSAGAQVVRVLQQMLADKEFEGYANTSENWILSLTSISGAYNGSTRTYIDGMREDDWRRIKPLCLLRICRIAIPVLEWFDIGFLKAYYNMGFDHFGMSWRKAGVWGLVDCLWGNAGPFASGDWILPDLTIHGTLQLNSRLQTFPNTLYFSYATKRTTKFMGFTVPSAVFAIHPLLLFKLWQMCQWRFPPEIELPYKGFRDEDWQHNDGALNTISMTHPRIPVEHPHHHVMDDEICLPLQPGIWYYKVVEADHMFFVMNRERAGVHFDVMYDGIFKRCRKHVFRKSPLLIPNQLRS